MSWRTVIISSRCKLDLKMGYLVVRGEEVKRIFLDEIAILVNLRSYFPDDSISRFLQTALDHQYQLLLVNAWEHPKLLEEQRLIIDKDLCEI